MVWLLTFACSPFLAEVQEPLGGFPSDCLQLGERANGCSDAHFCFSPFQHLVPFSLQPAHRTPVRVTTVYGIVRGDPEFLSSELSLFFNK